jgi:hypothetical protein
MATQASYASRPRCEVGQVSTANTARDGTGTIVSIFAAGLEGSRIDQIRIHATGTTTAGMIRLFIDDGTNTRLWKEIPVIASTPGASTPAWSANVASQVDLELPLVLPATHSLRAATNNAETFNISAIGGDF